MTPMRWVVTHWESLVFLLGGLLVLTGAQVTWFGPRLTQVELRVESVESRIEVIDAIALSNCLAETNPIARQRLECGRREGEAGIRR